MKSNSLRRTTLKALLIATLAVVATTSLASTASAGTWLKGRDCSLTQWRGGMDSSNVCTFTVNVTSGSYQCYSRFEALGAAPYVNHGTSIRGDATGTPNFQSGYTTAKTVWSPVGSCANWPNGPIYRVYGIQSGGNSGYRSYSLGFYSGSY